jgi:hypothetical protein
MARKELGQGAGPSAVLGEQPGYRDRGGRHGRTWAGRWPREKELRPAGSWRRAGAGRSGQRWRRWEPNREPACSTWKKWKEQRPGELKEEQLRVN